MTDREVIRALADALRPFAEWELPAGAVATFGPEWFYAWQTRAQAAMRASGESWLTPSERER